MDWPFFDAADGGARTVLVPAIFCHRWSTLHCTRRGDDTLSRQRVNGDGDLSLVRFQRNMGCVAENKRKHVALQLCDVHTFSCPFVRMP